MFSERNEQPMKINKAKKKAYPVTGTRRKLRSLPARPLRARKNTRALEPNLCVVLWWTFHVISCVTRPQRALSILISAMSRKEGCHGTHFLVIFLSDERQAKALEGSTLSAHECEKLSWKVFRVPISPSHKIAGNDIPSLTWLNRAEGFLLFLLFLCH